MSFDVRKKKNYEQITGKRGKQKTIQKSIFTDCKARNIDTAPENYALGTLGLLQ